MLALAITLVCTFVPAWNSPLAEGVSVHPSDIRLKGSVETRRATLKDVVRRIEHLLSKMPEDKNGGIQLEVLYEEPSEGTSFESVTRLSFAFRDPFMDEVLNAIAEAKGVEWVFSNQVVAVITTNPLDKQLQESLTTPPRSLPRDTAESLSQVIRFQFTLRHAELDDDCNLLAGTEPLRVAFNYRQLKQRFIDSDGEVTLIRGVRLLRDSLAVSIGELEGELETAESALGGEWEYYYMSNTSDMFGGSGEAIHSHMFPNTVPEGDYTIQVRCDFELLLEQNETQVVPMHAHSCLQIDRMHSPGPSDLKSLWLQHVFSVAYRHRDSPATNLRDGFLALMETSSSLANPILDTKNIGYVAHLLGLQDVAYEYFEQYISLYGLQSPLVFAHDQHREFYDLVRLFGSLCADHGYDNPYAGIDTSALLPQVVSLEGLDLETYNALKENSED